MNEECCARLYCFALYTPGILGICRRWDRCLIVRDVWLYNFDFFRYSIGLSRGCRARLRADGEAVTMCALPMFSTTTALHQPDRLSPLLTTHLHLRCGARHSMGCVNIHSSSHLRPLQLSHLHHPSLACTPVSADMKRWLSHPSQWRSTIGTP